MIGLNDKTMRALGIILAIARMLLAKKSRVVDERGIFGLRLTWSLSLVEAWLFWAHNLFFKIAIRSQSIGTWLACASHPHFLHDDDVDLFLTLTPDDHHVDKSKASSHVNSTCVSSLLPFATKYHTYALLQPTLFSVRAWCWVQPAVIVLSGRVASCVAGGKFLVSVSSSWLLFCTRRTQSSYASKSSRIEKNRWCQSIFIWF